MKFKLTKIGNSKGIRIPSSLIEACGFEDFIDVQIDEGKLILSSTKSARKNWKEAFQKMAENHDDELLDTDLIESEWDNKEWTW